MRILGIDPGLNATGYGVIEAEGGALSLVTAGVVRPPARQALGLRLRILHEALTQVLSSQRPVLMVLEALYTHHDYLTTATLMAHARGIVCLAGAQHGVPIVEYFPTHVKKAVTGHGAASKDQVARMVGVWLSMETSTLASDTTDALALAVAHAQLHRAAAPALAVKRRSVRAGLRKLQEAAAS
ncbi:MAG: crossover junction endodeoxyribonuclease RuvC [Candidatus Omnitrophica bacterium]|nr:crossover junction endodeoxyribonuclease RuvC [Candidatus Omnitrophota bacterium]